MFQLGFFESFFGVFVGTPQGVLRRDREFEDDGARKYMIKVFEILGGKGEIVSKYRGLLARTLN